MPENSPVPHGLSRRNFVLGVGAGVAAAASVALSDGYSAAAATAEAQSSGTVPEQVHLTWGADTSSEMTVSWLSQAPQVAPQLLVRTPDGRGRIVRALRRSYTDGLSGEPVYAYHAPVRGLSPEMEYTYVVSDAATPAVTFTSQFTTAGQGRFPFAFTSYGDLGTPGAGATYSLADGSTVASATYSESQWNAYNAVGEVENLAPLFHLLNGDLSYADKETITSTGGTTTAAGAQTSPTVWRDFGLNVQRSAANRPWMPCIGNHEAELDNGPDGYAAFNTRYLVPSNGTRYAGNFYSFRVGSVLFVALDANDVCYQGAGAYNVGGVAATDAAGNAIPATAAQYNQYYTGTFSANTDGTLSPGGQHPNAQTRWLEETLRQARADSSVDWIVVQMHQCALSSSTDNGCDVGIRQAWLPLFDRYEVDLVVNGHDHDYERSYPVRGFTAGLGTSTFAGGTVTQASGAVTLPSTKGQPVNTFTPDVVTTDVSGPFDTSQGTVYMVLGGGGTNKRDNVYGAKVANATTFTQIRTGAKPTPDATEPAAWSAMTDPSDAYGVAYFQVDPGKPGGNTTITVTYYHAPTQTSGTPEYTVLESFQMTRPRRDWFFGRRDKAPKPVLAGRHAE
ncbi:MAG TPA: metallophosphoesterase family protein [Streptosporangiaceae bacterium]|nr:metallophosphoesterase family protein [Streptosporangiaceae bacterium]